MTVSPTEKLIRMANQIATFFESQPQDGAPKQVAGHINEFWEPRMRAALLAHADTTTEGLKPLAIAALPHIRRPLKAAGTQGAAPRPEQPL